MITDRLEKLVHSRFWCRCGSIAIWVCFGVTPFFQPFPTESQKRERSWSGLCAFAPLGSCFRRIMRRPRISSLAASCPFPFVRPPNCFESRMDPIYPVKGISTPMLSAISSNIMPTIALNAPSFILYCSSPEFCNCHHALKIKLALTIPNADPVQASILTSAGTENKSRIMST